MVELQLLNLVLDKKDYTILSHNNLTQAHFPAYQAEYTFIRNHYEQYKVVPDKATVLDAFPKFDILEVAESEEYLINKITEEYVFRNAVPILKKGYELVQEDSIKGLEYLSAQMPSLQITRGIKVVDLVESAEKRLSKYREKMMAPQRAYITTGFKELDEIIGGWDREEENGVIVARTGQGKSWIAVNVALAAAKAGFRVGYYSGEMSDVKLGYRFDTFFSKVSNWKITHGVPDIDVEYTKAIDEFKKMSGHVFVLTPEHIGGLAGVSMLGTFIDKYNLDILLIDQVSLLKDDKQGRNLSDRMSNIATDIRVLQSTKKVPIISVLQFNRDKEENGELDTRQIAGSDRFGQDATFVLSIMQRPSNILELKIIKSRDARVGDKLTYSWNIDIGELTFIPTASSDTLAEVHTDIPKSEDIRSLYKDRKSNIF